MVVWPVTEAPPGAVISLAATICLREPVPTYRVHDTTGDEPGDVVTLSDGREALVTARVESKSGRSRRCRRL